MPKLEMEPGLNTRRIRLGAAGLGMSLLLSAAAPLGAQGTAHPCAGIEADAQRLACFDKAFPREGKAALAATAPVAAAQAERFGLPAPTPAPGSVLDAIEAKVASVGRLSRGERVFRLENGQQWAETHAEARGPVAPGDTVRIERAAFGSFLLVTPSRVGLRVRRLP